MYKRQGIKFLKHIERCKTLLHLIDITEDINLSYRQIREELGKYSKELLKKKELIVLNKIDLLSKQEIIEKIEKFSMKKNKEILILSNLKKETIKKLKSELLKYVS